jgi:prevent-host-death family protein
MKEIGISEFKAHALRMIDEVYKNRDRIIITRRGNPVAEVIPYQGPVDTIDPIPGKLESALVFEDDIVSPLGPESWEAAR